MTKVLRRPGMSWVLVLWSGYVDVDGDERRRPGTRGLWWLAGLIVFGSLRLATKPLFRQGAWRDAG